MNANDTIDHRPKSNMVNVADSLMGDGRWRKTWSLTVAHEIRRRYGSCILGRWLVVLEESGLSF